MCEAKETPLDHLFLAAWLRFWALIRDVDDGWFEGVWKGSNRTANPDVLGGFSVLHGGWQGFPPMSSASTSNKIQEKIPLKQLKNAFNVSVQARQILGLGEEQALDIMLFFFRIQTKNLITLISNLT